MYRFLRNPAPTSYTPLDNAAARNRNLSLGARGLLIELNYLGTHARTDARSLALLFPHDGEARVRRHLAELQHAGLLTRWVVRDPDTGRLHTETRASDNPLLLAGHLAASLGEGFGHRIPESR